MGKSLKTFLKKYSFEIIVCAFYALFTVYYLLLGIETFNAHKTITIVHFVYMSISLAFIIFKSIAMILNRKMLLLISDISAFTLPLMLIILFFKSYIVPFYMSYVFYLSIILGGLLFFNRYLKSPYRKTLYKTKAARIAELEARVKELEEKKES